MQQQPAYEDNWLELLAAIVDRARRDTSSPGIEEHIKCEARQFLLWLEREAQELRASLAH